MKTKTLHKLLCQIERISDRVWVAASAPVTAAIAYHPSHGWLAYAALGSDGEPFQVMTQTRLLKSYCRVESRNVVAAMVGDRLEITAPGSRYTFAPYPADLIKTPWPSLVEAKKTTIKIFGLGVAISEFTPLYWVCRQPTTELQTMLIEIANSYYVDLKAAQDAGIPLGNGSAKNPTKAELYAAIEAHNAAQVAPEPTPEPANEFAALYQEFAAPKAPKVGKLDRLRVAISDGITDVDILANITGMKPQGVKAWMGVINGQGLDNWRKASTKSAKPAKPAQVTA